jgi:hypothetical protein
MANTRRRGAGWNSLKFHKLEFEASYPIPPRDYVASAIQQTLKQSFYNMDTIQKLKQKDITIPYMIVAAFLIHWWGVVFTYS